MPGRVEGERTSSRRRAATAADTTPQGGTAGIHAALRHLTEDGLKAARGQLAVQQAEAARIGEAAATRAVRDGATSAEAIRTGGRGAGARTAG